MMKSSKKSVLFAQVHNIERFKGATKVNPGDFTPEELKAFEDFKKQQKQERVHAHYEKKKSEGKLPQKATTADMSEDELQRVRDIKRRNGLRVNYRKRYPAKSKDEIEEMVQKYIDENPCGDNDKMKSGPAKGSTMTKRQAITPVTVDPSGTSKEEYVPAEREDKGPRLKDDSKDDPNIRPIKKRRTDCLQTFLNEHPDIQRVDAKSELSEDNQRLYKRWKERTNSSRDPSKMKAKADLQREKRAINPQHYRDIEAKSRNRPRQC